MARAEFCSQASLPMSRESLRRSPAPASCSMTWVSPVPLTPMSPKVWTTFPPLSLTPLSPLVIMSTARTGSDSNAWANCLEDTPATLARFSRPSPPVFTSSYILFMTRDITPPPSSDWIPTEAMAFARASTSDSVAPASLPAPERRWDISRMSFSVDAPLLPSSTRVEPKRLISEPVVPITFAICAIEVDASSAVRFVDSPRSIIVFVNETTSFVFTPS